MREWSRRQAGALRHRLILEAPDTTPDGGGGEDVVWRETAALWGAIRPVRGREKLAAGQYASTLSHEIVMRFHGEVQPNKRFRLGARIFHILAVLDDDERHEWLKVLCEERNL